MASTPRSSIAARLRARFRRRAAPASRPPNVLVLMSDEHNAGVAGFAGSPLARTPRLDALAAGGLVVDGCYCSSPLCGPSRLSMTAGRYASRVGAWGNASWLPSDEVSSIARVMTGAGYDALLCGKQHYDATRRYGFHEIGSWRTNQYRKRGVVKRRRPDDLAPPPALSKRFSNFRPAKDSPVLRHDRAVTEEACRFLAGRRRGDAPFFLWVGWLAPHFPLIVPHAYWEHYRGRVAPPHVPPGHLESQPLNYRHLRLGFAMHEVPEETVQRGRELYHGLVEWMDEQAGQVLDALGRSRVADDTVVVYTSDHGENLGEHGLWWKNCMYDAAARVPLLVSWPARWAGGQRRSGACSLLDLIRTLADLGGAETPEDWDGRSLLPWLDDPAARWESRALAEYYGHNVASAFTMWREEDWKYVYHVPPDAEHPAEHELYDLFTDPEELVNLAERPEHAGRRSHMHEAMLRELGGHPDDIDARCRAEIARGYERPDLDAAS
jgi:choline-sulfatase